MGEKEVNTNYGFSDIHRYLNGQMTAKEMHDLERAALQDAFLADAIEGYQDRNKEQTEKHLNEITAAIQGNQQRAKIIAISKRKRYSWMAAASILFLLGITVFIFHQNQNDNRLAMEASNNVKRNETKDSFMNKNNKLLPPQTEPKGTAMQDATISAKQKKDERNETAILKKKEHRQNKIASSSKTEDSMLMPAAPAAALAYRSKEATAQPSLPATADTVHNDSMDKGIRTGYTTRAFASSPKPSWTTEKGKPFYLSEVEVINMNKKMKKATDTSSIKPEGGWPLFQDYLFGKLNKKDSSAIVNRWNSNSNLELEFSVSETGLPYNVQVLNAPDSAMANKAVAAIKGGPKWINTEKKEKRLNLKF